MYLFAQKGWYEKLAGGFTVWVIGFNMEIDIESFQGRHGDSQLQTNHIIMGLYETITDITARSRFCEVLSTLSIRRRQVGTLTIQKRASRTPEQDEANATSSMTIGKSQNSNAITYPSGLITDSDDLSFSISYTYSGVRLNSKDVFSATLDALASTAFFSPSATFRSLNAISASGDCLINVVEVDNPLQVNYSFVTKALRTMIIDIMVPLRVFGAMSLQLKWDGLNMAEGSIKLADHGSSA